MMDSKAQKSLLLFSVTTVSVYWILKLVRKCFFEDHGTVLRLIIYPIKSISGIEVDRLEITKTGVKYRNLHDRTFMLLNEQNQMVTQRTHPSLSLISVSFDCDDDVISLNVPGNEILKISISLNLSSNEIVDFKLWNQDVRGAIYSEEANQWFSRHLKFSTKLAKFLPESMSCRATLIQTKEATLFEDPNYPIIYQDRCAVHLVNQTSIDDLNNRMTKHENRVTHTNFRPNILIKVTGDPFIEDSFNKFRIGQVKFTVAKPTKRCTTTTVIPGSGETNSNLEPLHTLRKYRVNQEWKHLYQNSPLFGISLKPESTGFVSIGDRLIV